MRMIPFIGLLLFCSPAFADAWYEGGTLQKATVADWVGATSENQLATAGDFIASLGAVSDISAKGAAEQADIKKQSIELQGCINDAAAQPETPRDKSIAELVVLCTVMKKKE